MNLITQWPIDSLADRIRPVQVVTPARRFTKAQIREWCEQNPDRLKRPKIAGPKETVLPSMHEMHEKRRKFLKSLRGTE